MVRVSSWRKYGWLRHAFSRRDGGISTVYSPVGGAGELNLGWTKEDDPALVRENRRRFIGDVAGAFDGDGGWPLVTVRQVHSDAIRVVRLGDGAFEGALETEEGKAILVGDGLITNVPGLLVGVQTADCVPVMVVDVVQRAVGVFHAGWRGTVAGIVEKGIATMQEEYGSLPENLAATVGPSIGSCCYSVGEDVKASFMTKFEYGANLFREVDGAVRLDLWESNRRQLMAAGVSAHNIVVMGECTGCSVSASGGLRYFSHRIEGGVAGRMLSVVGIATPDVEVA